MKTFLIVFDDGSTRSVSAPDLETAVRGQDNPLAHPVAIVDTDYHPDSESVKQASRKLTFHLPVSVPSRH